MGSFGGMSRLRTGYWRGIRDWLLREGVDVERRIQAIGVERNRIGTITVVYGQKGVGASVIRTESRRAFAVSPGSSLEKLVQAYVMMGGNPLDISMFMLPDRTVHISSAKDHNDVDVYEEVYPYGGVAAPVSAHGPEDTTMDRGSLPDGAPVQASDYSSYPGGKLNLKKYSAERIGGQARLVWLDVHTSTSHTIHKARRWANQEIAEKLHLLEHKIIKLMDLREQLWGEYYFELGQAWAGTIAAFDATAMPSKLIDGQDLSFVDDEDDSDSMFGDRGIYVKVHTLASIVSDLDDIFFVQQKSGQTMFVPQYDDLLVNTQWAYGDLPQGEEALLTLMM